MKNALLFVIIVLFVLVSNIDANEPLLPECSSSRHEHPSYYYVTGPDGNTYPTWHSQVDPDYGCHFGHEHGTAPTALMPGYEPIFGYAAAQAGLSMNNEGYKVFGWNDGNYVWFVTLHQGGSGQGRVCARYHDMAVAVFDSTTRERLVEVYFLGDFGPAEISGSNDPFYPVACPGQHAAASGSNGVRKIPTVDTGGLQSLYEAWRLSDWSNQFGLDPGEITFNVNPLNIPDDNQAASFTITGQVGDRRSMIYHAPFGFHNPPNTGQFCTNSYGTQVLDCEEPNAVIQYINPSITDLVPYPDTQRCDPRSGFDYTFVCSNSNPFNIYSHRGFNHLGGLRSPN